MLPPPVVVGFTQLRARIPVSPKHFNLNLPFATLLSRTIGFALPIPSLHRHTLRQIPRLIHIRPSRTSRVISQQLKRHDMKNRR